MPARLPPNRTVNSRAVLAKMERWSRAALARLAKQAEHTDRSGATQTVFHSTASSLPIPFVICRLLLTASSGAKYDEKSGLTARSRKREDDFKLQWPEPGTCSTSLHTNLPSSAAPWPRAIRGLESLALHGE